MIDGNWDVVDHRDLYDRQSRQGGRRHLRGRREAGLPPLIFEVRSDSSGWDMQVYGTAEDPPPDDIEGWGKQSDRRDDRDRGAHGDPARVAGKLRYYLVWITSPAAAEDDDGFLVQINEIRLLA